MIYKDIWVQTTSAGRLYFLSIDELFNYLNQYNDATFGYIGLSYE